LKSKVVFFAVAGWSGNTPGQNFGLLEKRIKERFGENVEMVAPDYLKIKGPFKKLRTHKSIWQYARIVQSSLDKVKKEYPETPIIIMGHSMGALIVRIMYFWRDSEFADIILVGGPHKGFHERILKLRAVAKAFHIKPFFEMCPESKLLEEIGGFPDDALYIGGEMDNVVPMMSAVPEEMSRKMALPCDHNMIPYSEEKEADSAIPVILKILEKHVQIVQ